MPADRPVLTVVTPVLNGARHLGRCVESVAELARGSGVPMEHVIADGGSTDGTLELARSAQRSPDTPVSEVLHGPDRGQSHAINRAAERARGEWIGWLNADDWYEPSAAAMVQSLASPEVGGADVVVGRCRFVDERGRVVFEPEPPDLGSRAALLRPLSQWFAGRCIVQPEAFVRRGSFVDAGGLDESNHFAMDHDLWLRLLERGARFASDARVVAGQLVHRDQKTADNLAVADAVVRNCERSLARLPLPDSAGAEREIAELRRRIAVVRKVMRSRPAGGVFERRDVVAALHEGIVRQGGRRGTALAVGSAACEALANAGWPGGRMVRVARPLPVHNAFDLIVADAVSAGASALEPGSIVRGLRPGGAAVVAACDPKPTRDELHSLLRRELAARVTWNREPWSDELIARVSCLMGWLGRCSGHPPLSSASSFAMGVGLGIRPSAAVRSALAVLGADSDRLGEVVVLRRRSDT